MENNTTQDQKVDSVDTNQAEQSPIKQDIEKLEEVIEQQQMQQVQYNFDKEDIDQIYDYLLQNESLPDSLKKNLFFIQSDQELLIENLNQIDHTNQFLQTKLCQLEVDNKKLKDLINERETEIRILKRERDEQFTIKMEVSIENKRIKTEFEKLQKQLQEMKMNGNQSYTEDTMSTNSSNGHYNNNTQNNSQNSLQTPRDTTGVNKLFKLFGAGALIQGNNNVNNQQQQQQKKNQPVAQPTPQKKPIVIDEQYENEQKQVINNMQDQILSKIMEIKGLQKQIEDLNQELGKTKGNIAIVKERCEDLSTDIEIYQLNQRKTDQMLIQKDKEISDLKLELQKVRSTSEKELKKLRKAYEQQAQTKQPTQPMSGGNTANTAQIVSTSGSNQGNKSSVRTGEKSMFDPFSMFRNQHAESRLSIQPQPRGKMDLNATYADPGGENMFNNELESQNGKKTSIDDSATKTVSRNRMATQKSHLFQRTLGILGFGKQQEQPQVTPENQLSQ